MNLKGKLYLLYAVNVWIKVIINNQEQQEFSFILKLAKHFSKILNKYTKIDATFFAN